MDISKHVNRLLRRARPFTLICDGGERQIKALLQPMRYKNKLYVDDKYTELGVVDSSTFLFIASADLEVNEGVDYLLDGDGCGYAFIKAEKVYCMDKPAYTWAIVRERSV